MFSQKSLSHSPDMVYAAPSLRLLRLISLSYCRFGFLAISASSLADVRAARGGLDGGVRYPEPTSGIPLGPAGAGSGVMEACEARGVVDDVC